MFFRIIKILCKLFGMAGMVKIVKEGLRLLAYTLQHSLKARAKQVAQMCLLVSLAFVLLSLGFCFLLLGLGYWLNAIFSSAYLGFFLVSIFCFLVVMLMVCMLRNLINGQEAKQGRMTVRN